jgi:hypothetical protein
MGRFRLWHAATVQGRMRRDLVRTVRIPSPLAPAKYSVHLLPNVMWYHPHRGCEACAFRLTGHSLAKYKLRFASESRRTTLTQ